MAEKCNDAHNHTSCFATTIILLRWIFEVQFPCIISSLSLQEEKNSKAPKGLNKTVLAENGKDVVLSGSGSGFVRAQEHRSLETQCRLPGDVKCLNANCSPLIHGCAQSCVCRSTHCWSFSLCGRGTSGVRGSGASTWARRRQLSPAAGSRRAVRGGWQLLCSCSGRLHGHHGARDAPLPHLPKISGCWAFAEGSLPPKS